MKSLFRRSFRIQYASNLFAKAGALAPGIAPNLALLGNSVSVETAESRWRARDFLSFCAENWKRTYLVPAHTELGCSGAKPVPWTDLLDELRLLVQTVNKESQGQVVVADQFATETPEGIRLLSFTGWNAWSRDGLGSSNMHAKLPTLYMNTAPMSSAEGHTLSQEDMEWVHAELRVDRHTPTVLLSHGLSMSTLVKPGLSAATYKQSDLMSLYPFPFLFSREGCIKACLCGAAIGGSVSGVIGGRFHAVNSYWENPAYRPDAFYEYSWSDDVEGGVRDLVESYARSVLFPTRVFEPVPVPARTRECLI